MNVSDLQAGDILLYSGQSTIGKLIKRLDGTDVTHVGIYLGNGQVGEALMMGNRGINSNPVVSSIQNTDWVEVRRLKNTGLDLKDVLDIADKYIAEGNRYAYVEIVLLAMILMTRKVKIDDWLISKIAWSTFRYVNDWINEVFDAGKEPMICSEFVFRCYDEVDPADDDPYSIEILSQEQKSPRRLFSRFRLKERFRTAKPETEVPTIHPDSILAKALKEPAKLSVATAPKATMNNVSKEQIDEIIAKYLDMKEEMKTGKEPSFAAMSLPEVSEADLEAEALELAKNLTSPARLFLNAAQYSTAPIEAQGMAVFSDFVTPGDIFKSPSLTKVGRIQA